MFEADDDEFDWEAAAVDIDWSKYDKVERLPRTCQNSCCENIQVANSKRKHSLQESGTKKLCFDQLERSYFQEQTTSNTGTLIAPNPTGSRKSRLGDSTNFPLQNQKDHCPTSSAAVASSGISTSNERPHCRKPPIASLSSSSKAALPPSVQQLPSTVATPVPTEQCRMSYEEAVQQTFRRAVPFDESDLDGRRNDTARLIFHTGSHLTSHQKSGVAHILDRDGNTLLYDEMGLGKSLTALYAMAFTCLTQNAWPCLIVCPAVLRNTWFEQIERWLPFINMDQVSIVTGSASTLTKGTKIVICSYRLLKIFEKEFHNMNIQYLICDEVQSTRSFYSSTSIYLVGLAAKIPRMTLITGSPMLIRPFEIFVQLELALSKEDKESLMPGWGENSHLRQVLMNPLNYLYEVYVITGATFSMNWALSRFKAQNISVVWSRLADSQKDQLLVLLDQVISLIRSLIKIGFVLTTKVKKGEPQEYTLAGKVFVQLRRHRTSVVGSHSFDNLQRSLTSLRRTWGTLSSVKSPFFLQQIHHLWNGHRFGVSHCDGRKGFLRHKGWPWMYRGNSKKVGAVLGPYVILRKKQDVLDDLPGIQRSATLLTLNEGGKSEFCEVDVFQGKNSGILNLLSRVNGERVENIIHELAQVGVAKAEHIADFLIELLGPESILEKTERVIVFAHHLEVLRIIQRKLLQQRGNDPNNASFNLFSSKLLEGKVPVAERNKDVQSFQEGDDGPRVLLLSIMAMGTGVTLTRCSYVVMAELHWSPEVLLQAEARVHRIGQKQDVKVLYMLAKDTVDTRVYPILQSRLETMKSMLPRMHKPESSSAVVTCPSSQVSIQIREVSQYCSQLSQSTSSQFTFAVEQVPTYDGKRLLCRLGLQDEDVSPKVCDASKLRYRVSVNNRIHLYREDSEGHYSSLNENFGIQEFRLVNDNLLSYWEDRSNDINVQSIRKLPVRLYSAKSGAYLRTQAFIEEWFELDNRQKNCLLDRNKPLRIPLSSELEKKSRASGETEVCFDRVCKSVYQMHKAAMSVFGAGNYCVAYVNCQISDMSNAVSTGTTYNCLEQGFELVSGKPLCLFCGNLYDSDYALQANCEGAQVTEGTASTDHFDVAVVTVNGTLKKLFCGNGPCFTSWRMKCYMHTARRLLSQIDEGICAECGVDTRRMCRNSSVHPPNSPGREQQLFCTPGGVQTYCSHFVPSSSTNNRKTRLHWSNHQRAILAGKLSRNCNRKGGKSLERLLSLPKLTEGMFWDADHKHAVALGGGAPSTIDHFQTLCTPCHKIKTETDLKKIRKISKLQVSHMGVARTYTLAQVKRMKKSGSINSLTCMFCGHSCRDEAAKVRHLNICPDKPGN